MAIILKGFPPLPIRRGAGGYSPRQRPEPRRRISEHVGSIIPYLSALLRCFFMIFQEIFRLRSIGSAFRFSPISIAAHMLSF